MLSTPEQYTNRLTAGNLSPVYLLFGEEEFLVEEALTRLLKEIVTPEVRDFNFDRFNGGEADLDEVIDRALSYPMMADRRVVLLREVDKTIGRKRKFPALESYLASPPETTILVCTVPGANLESRGKKSLKAPYDLFAEAGEAVNYKKLYDRQIPSWIQRRVDTLGREIDPEGIELLHAYVGTDLRGLAAEIDKLLIFAGADTPLTADHVRDAVGASRSFNVFELQKEIGARNAERSLEIAYRMIQAGEAPQMIITMLTRYFTILWKLSEAKRKSRDKKDLARTAGISPWFVDEYLAASSRYAHSEIVSAFEALLAADVALKSTGGDPDIVIQMLVISLVQGSDQMYHTEAA